MSKIFIVDSFQLTSGYTSINGKRYVFNCNYDKIPTPKEMIKYFQNAGMKLDANIKPCLLLDHPRYQEVETLDYLLKIMNQTILKNLCSGMMKALI